MPKDFVPCDIEELSILIENYRKINNMTEEEEKELFLKLLHNNFCRYINIRGKNKNVMCLNRFNDMNELKYCHTHRWEIKPWINCQTYGCNGKTKKDFCRKCKKINKLIKIIHLPLQDEKELFDLSNEYINYEIIRTIIPNAKYRIKNYHLHTYYKIHTISMNLIMPSYDQNGIKIKKIKNNEYCKYFYKNKNDFIKDMKKNIHNYNINKEFNISVFYTSVKILILIKKWKKKYISLETACNIPLPPISYDEEILLNTNFNELYEKKINNKKESNIKMLELDISENNINKNNKTNEKFIELCNIFKDKCMDCYKYKRFILDMCTINVNIYNILIDKFNEVNNKNLIKINEIFDIFKKPKIKPVQINKIYNDLPSILSYGEIINKLIDKDLKELCKTYYIIYKDIDDSIKNHILEANFSKYLFD